MHFPFSLGKSTENVLKSQFWASVPRFLRFLTGSWMHFNVASNHIFQVGHVRAPPMASFLPISLLLYPITSSCQPSRHRTTNSLLPHLSKFHRLMVQVFPSALSIALCKGVPNYHSRLIANHREDPINFRSSLDFLFYSLQHLI